MSWVTWTLTPTGLPIDVDPSQVAYIEENTVDPTTCFVGLVSGGQSRIQVTRTAALAAGDVHTATGIVVGGYPAAPLVEVAQTGDPSRSLYFRGSTVASLQDLDTAVTLVNTQGPELPWSVAVAHATLRDDLIAAEGTGGGGTQVAPLLLGFAAVLGTTGAVIPGSLTVWNGLDIVVASDPAYVPASGVYALPITGTDVPPAGLGLGFEAIIGGGIAGIQQYAAAVGTWTIVDGAGLAHEPGAFLVFLYGVVP